MTFWFLFPFLISTIFMWIFQFPSYTFHWKYFHYLYYNNLVSRIWPYQIYVSRTIIVSKNAYGIVALFQEIEKNLKFRLNVWKHTINNYGFIFFQSSISLFFPPHFIILGAKSIRSRVALQQKVSLCAKWFH
jgi:hypothetical protein